MKTTIDLPDEVLRKAKVFAAEHRTTLRELVIEGLELVRRQSEAVTVEERRAKAARLLAALQAQNTEPMVPLKREEIYDRKVSPQP